VSRVSNARRESRYFHMMNFNKIAAGTAIAGSLGLAALGIGTGVANRRAIARRIWNPMGAESRRATVARAERRRWRLERRAGTRDTAVTRLRRAGPPPAGYGYGGYGGGYDNGAVGCITGPLGLLHFCPSRNALEPTLSTRCEFGELTGTA